MRTTLTLADDVADRLLELQKKQGLTLKEAVNQTLRAGLERQMAHPAPKRPKFKVRSRAGIRPGLNYDDIGGLIERLDLGCSFGRASDGTWRIIMHHRQRFLALWQIEYSESVRLKQAAYGQGKRITSLRKRKRREW